MNKFPLFLELVLLASTSGYLNIYLANILVRWKSYDRDPIYQMLAVDNVTIHQQLDKGPWSNLTRSR